ncbi:MAG: hypothetical protein ABW061_22300 [Polyangiaceae bacterium]
MKADSDEQQLRAFFAKYTPAIAALGKALRSKLRKRLPGAVELVYDNYNALVIAFAPSERASEAIFSIALYPRWVNLFFAAGAGLPDPQHLLQGDGKAIRHVVLHAAADFDQPALQALLTHALKRAAKPLDASAKRRLIIKSVAPRQRPRRPATPEKAEKPR